MIKKQIGLGIIEVMIGLVLLTLAAIVVATLATQSHMSTGVTAAGTDCGARAEAVLAVFKNADNKIQMENFHASAAQPFPTAPYPHLERFARPFANPTPGNSLASQYTNGWQLINSGSNWALALYNATGPGLNFCSTPFAPGPSNEIFSGVAPAGFAAWGPPNPIYPAGTPLTNEKIYLDIQRKDFGANTLDCSNQGKQRLVPLSPTNGTDNDPTLGNNIGLQVSVNIQFTNSLGDLAQCSRSTFLRPDGDSVAPAFVPVPADILPGGTCPVANCNCGVSNLCIFNAPPGSYEVAGPPVLCGNPTVSVSAADSEPGTVFGCELDFSATNPPPSVPIPFYRSCASFTVAGATGKVTAIHLAADNSTGIKIDLTGLTNLGYYTLFIEAMDSAQNPTMEFIQFQYKTTCP